MSERPIQRFSGSCLCGALEFEYLGPSLWCAHCHCSLCRRAHGAALVTWVGVSAPQFKLIKSESLKWHSSSKQGQRGFCTQCGSTVFFRSEQWPDEVHIARANLPDELDIEPSAHVTYGSVEAPWFKFQDALPHMHSSQ